MRTFNINDKIKVENLRQLGEIMFFNPDLFLNAFNDPAFRIWMRSEDEKLAEKAIITFVQEKDPIVGLFKASYVLNPGHNFTYGGKKYSSFEEIGLEILNNAPYINDSLMSLFKNKLLLWYMEMREENLIKQDKYNYINEISNNSKFDDYISYFLFGYALYGKLEFFFEGNKYKSIKEFFINVKDDENVLSKYDFATMPYIKSWYIAEKDYDKFNFAASLLETNKYFLENCLISLKLK